MDEKPAGASAPPPPDPPVNRRDFLRAGAVALSGAAATAAALSPLRELETPADAKAFFQTHYLELTPPLMKDVLERIEAQTEKKFGVRPTVDAPPPLDGVEFVYCLNVGRCIGCRRCVHACAQENNLSRSPAIQYIRVLKMPLGTINLELSEHNYDPQSVPEKGVYYMPVQCHQCKNPPCVKACPVEATWQEPDGITVIDYDWCIGCRYCAAACPYWARRFNFAEPGIEAGDLNLSMSYLSNRPRAKGVMEKCTFCLHRTRKGQYPACLEVCPVGARLFGDIADPDSSVSYVLRNKRVFILKEEVGTLPRFYYFFDE